MCLSLLFYLGTHFSQPHFLVKDCHFGVVPVNYSNSDNFESTFSLKRELTVGLFMAFVDESVFISSLNGKL